MGNQFSFAQTKENSDIEKIQYKCDLQRLEKLLNIGRVLSNYHWSKEKHGYRAPATVQHHFKADNVQLLIVPEQEQTTTPKSRKDSLKWQIREYFIEKPDHEIEKYMENGDVMIENGYVYIEEDTPVTTTDADAIKLRLIDFAAGSIG